MSTSRLLFSALERRIQIMPLPDWKEVIKKDFPTMGSITAETKRAMLENRHRFRGGVRISTGRVWETEEYEERRNRVLNTPLP